MPTIKWLDTSETFSTFLYKERYLLELPAFFPAQKNQSEKKSSPIWSQVFPLG